MTMESPLGKGWHISPQVDSLAYHFSWLFVLVPLALSGKPGYEGTFSTAIFVGVVTVTIVHRHLTLFYGYFDSAIWRAHARRLTYFPLAVVALCFATPFLRDHSVLFRNALPAVVFFAVLWNFWHVLMQKFGLLRLYAAKSGLPNGQRIPASVDRWFVWCWVPVFFCFLGPRYQDLILQNGPSVSTLTQPLFAALSAWQPVTVPLSVAIVLFGVGHFLWHEHKTHKLANTARLSLGLGLVCQYLVFFFLDPVQAYLAFGFNHAVEYMFFAGNFLQRRYRDPSRSESPLAKVLQFPTLFYISLFVILGGGSFVMQYWGRYFMTDEQNFQIGGIRAASWIFYWNVYESLIHFYLDGFLWKMRDPEVRRFVGAPSEAKAA